MLDTTRSGRTKLEAAVDAAKGFVRLLDLEADAASVVSFNRESHIATTFTRDLGELTRALESLPQGPGTRIDLGLSSASQVISGSSRNVENVPVVILLTDGRPTLSTPQEVVAEARKLAGAGATIYAIGLGPDVDAELLADITGDEDRVVLTPDAEELRAIYAEIAKELPCIRP
jgi:Mg-chelatase subunit ChlD